MENNSNIKEIETSYCRIISCNQNQSDEIKIKKPLLNSHELIIPAYQRPYSWTKKNIEQLLNDLLHQVKFFKNEDYFLGMIFTLEKSNGFSNRKYEIVDGQQRITTILLILTYFKLLFNGKEYIKFTDEIKKINLFSESEKDNQILSKIINCKSLEELFKILNKEKKEAEQFSDLFYLQQVAVFKSVLITIHKFIQKNNINDYPIEIYRYIFNNVKVLHIVSRPDSLIGDQFFSSLNGKGLKLDQVDLLKSLFIHPYVDSIKGIKNFKDKWASLIKNTKNNMLNEIDNYFASYTKNQKKITPSKLNDFLIKEWANDQDIKKEFEKMCAFFDKYAILLDANTKNSKINFYVKLNQKFKFDKYKKVVFTAIMNTPEFSIDNKNDLNVIAKILESLFKINFIYLTILGCTASQFIGDVINRYIRFEEKMSAVEISESLTNQLDEILNFSDANVGEKFKNYDSLNYDLLNYDLSNTNNYKILFILNLISETYSVDQKDLEYNKAISMIRYQLDHRVQKAEKKALFYDENNKKWTPWSTKIKDRKKWISFSDPFYDAFTDMDFNDKYHIKKDNMAFEEFVDMLNKPFNLKLLEKLDNQHKSSISRLTKDNLKEHFTIANENIVREKLTKAWNWILHSTYEKKVDDIDSSSSYINAWRIIERYLTKKITEQGFKQDLESIRKEKYFLSKLINLSFGKKIIDNRDDFNLCKHILHNRNEAQHNGGSDKFKKNYDNLIKEFLKKIKI